MTFTSWPSSLKIVNPHERTLWIGRLYEKLLVTPNVPVSVKINVKQENVTEARSELTFDGWNGDTWQRIDSLFIPGGTFDWTQCTKEVILPSNVTTIRSNLGSGGGTQEFPAKTWFDDLIIYQNGELIYENTFDNWLPYIIGGGIITVAGVAGVTKLMKIW